MMEILVLGNGGAINDGLPYNCFLVNRTTLVEAPPDVMLSLHREDVSISGIDEIFISHLHGDHCFGFPFLALELFFRSVRDGNPRKRTVYVPGGGADRLIELTAMALGAGHPCIGWTRDFFEVTDISVTNPIRLAGRETLLHRMEHFVETWGFEMRDGAKSTLAYAADTLWCGSLERIIASGPETIIIDLNGEPDDPVRVHVSEAELIEKGIPMAHPGTRFYGTHLKHFKTPGHERIRYVHPGMIISARDSGRP